MMVHLLDAYTSCIVMLHMLQYYGPVKSDIWEEKERYCKCWRSKAECLTNNRLVLEISLDNCTSTWLWESRRQSQTTDFQYNVYLNETLIENNIVTCHRKKVPSCKVYLPKKTWITITVAPVCRFFRCRAGRRIIGCYNDVSSNNRNELLVSHTNEKNEENTPNVTFIVLIIPTAVFLVAAVALVAICFGRRKFCAVQGADTSCKAMKESGFNEHLALTTITQLDSSIPSAIDHEHSSETDTGSSNYSSHQAADHIGQSSHLIYCRNNMCQQSTHEDNYYRSSQKHENTIVSPTSKSEQELIKINFC
ncbi:uncharacterized protein LOC127729196 isoform X2 [Mytilus californianus]|nr:uncharacterized protein LOC127729196 isoform X2 [Mytilus californianus]